MKKHILLSLTLTSCLLFSACSSQEEAPVATTVVPETEQANVTTEPTPQETTPDDGFVLETKDYVFNDENLALEGINTSQKVTLVEYTGTDTDLVIPEGVQVIGESALLLGNFESITFPSTLEIIGWNALYNNDKLTSVTLPEGLLIIDGSAFQDCYGLEFLTLPQSLRGMTTASFGGTALTSVRLPENMEYLSVGIFKESQNLQVVEVKAESPTATALTPVSLLISGETILEPTFYQ